MSLLRALIISIFVCSFTAQAQYTETINSNRPGASSGAYAVGINVIQAEGGITYMKNKHELRKQDFGGAGLEYEFRYGVWKEALEVNLSGAFQFGNITDNNAGTKTSLGNFKINSLGAKYLFYETGK